MANKLNVQGTEITILKINTEDYICLTDMLKAKDGEFFITDWLRNRNTLEYIGIWEKFNNPNFNYGEFATIRNSAGLLLTLNNISNFTPPTMLYMAVQRGKMLNLTSCRRCA